MSKKTVYIPSELHEELIKWAFVQKPRRSLMDTIAMALTKFIADNPITPENGITVTAPVIIPRQPVGRPSHKKWKMPNCEIRAMAMENIPSRVAQANIGKIALKWHISEEQVISENDQTSIIMDIAGFYFGMPAAEYTILSDIDGLSNLIEVSGNTVFAPENELAIKILALMPGRESYSKELLFILDKAGFSIKYID